MTTRARGQRLVRVLNLAVLLDRVPRPSEQPPGGQESLHAHRSTRMDAGGADAHLSAQPKSETIRKARGGVVEDARAVHPPQEVLCLCLVGWSDREHGQSGLHLKPPSGHFRDA